MSYHYKDYWTKEKCQELALECKSRSEFHTKYRAAFDVSSKNNWLNDLCSHMNKLNNNYRCIYVYEFSDNNAYIGLTYNLNKRHYRHMNNNGSVYKYIKKTDIIPELKQLTDYLEIEDAKLKELYYVEKYKNEGWNILNKAKTGSIGGITLIWNKEKCKEQALKCKTRTEFYKKFPSASGSALKNGWLDDICSHMKELYKKRGYWNNYENCLNEAKKYTNIKNFRLNSKGAYNSLRKKKYWKNKIYSYMNWL